MDLACRLMEDKDWEESLRLLQDGYLVGYTEEARDALPSFWRQLVRENIWNAMVVEDLSRPSDRIVMVGVTVFINDQFVQEAKEGGVPFVGARLVERVLQGQSPLLDAKAIRRANARGGLNVFLLNFASVSRRLSAQENLLLNARAPEGFMLLNVGYRIREILIEHFDEYAWHFMLASGFRLRNDYAAFFNSHGLSLPPPGQCPRLLGITREEALAQPGSYVSVMFQYTPPRLLFRPAEQQLLLQALRGKTDGEIAAALSLSRSTVKSHWRAIYDRVDEHAPGLLSPICSAEQKRGAEKRRVLLNFLRHHLEELRPFDARSGRA